MVTLTLKPSPSSSGMRAPFATEGGSAPARSATHSPSLLMVYRARHAGVWASVSANAFVNSGWSWLAPCHSPITMVPPGAGSWAATGTAIAVVARVSDASSVAARRFAGVIRRPSSFSCVEDDTPRGAQDSRRDPRHTRSDARDSHWGPHKSGHHSSGSIRTVKARRTHPERVGPRVSGSRRRGPASPTARPTLPPTAPWATATGRASSRGCRARTGAASCR